MRVAVTGAAGYIGGWLCRALQVRGHLISAQDRVRIPGTAHPVFDLADGDVRREWLRLFQPDVVIHLAALYGRVWGEKDMIATAAANAGLTAELARDVAATGSRLMYMSSSEVYGASATGIMAPDSPLQPLNMYGLSKKWGEEAAQVYAPDGLMITRLNMPYGPPLQVPAPGERPGTSGVPGMTGYNVLHSMLWQAHNNLPITVHLGTDRSFTWAGDSVRGLIAIAESRQSGIWNVCRNDDHIAISELAKQCVDMVPGCTSRITEIEPDSQITVRKSLDATELLALGWRPQTDLATGMKRTLEYFSRFGPDGRWAG